MLENQTVGFGPFRLEPHNGMLWRDKRRIKLTRKSFQVLCYLAQRSGQLVAKAELFHEIWPQVVVGDASLTRCIREIRQMLKESARAPKYIETVHGQGYRFISNVVTSQHAGTPSFSSPTPDTGHLTPLLVGREAELTHLQGCLEKALNGERQIVFITGEPGIGKTALMEAFLQQLRAEQEGNPTPHTRHPTPLLFLARGQCVEHYGPGEAYLPVLEALGRLCRVSEGKRVIDVLRRYAPTWLVQLPFLLEESELKALQNTVMGATRERMLREMAEAVEALTVVYPMVLVFEDLHWSDPSTIMLLAYLARRLERQRLLVIGVYRPAEVFQRKHPLSAVRNELVGQGLCTEIPLSFLSEAAVEDYLQKRAPDTQELKPLAPTLYRRTAGHPLFMVATVEEWLFQTPDLEGNGRGEARQAETSLNGHVPERLRQLVWVQMERLPRKEQQVLEAASVAGFEFSTAEVAAALTMDDVAIEDQCEQIAQQQQFLRPAGIKEWPDGTIAARYGFRHVVYQSLWQERVKAGRWRRYHQLIGERKEAAYGDRAETISAELALHFEQGRDYRKAIHYFRQAAQTALTRSAHSEAINHLATALKLLKTLPPVPEHLQQELMLQTALGKALLAPKGYTAPEVRQVYTRARELCAQVGDTHQLFPVLWGLFGIYMIGGELQTAKALGTQMLRLAQSVQDPALLLEAHHLSGHALYFLGELLRAREHFEQGVSLYNPGQHHSHAFLYGHDPGVTCLGYTALVLWYLGYPDQALRRSHEALALAQKLSHPYSLGHASITSARLHQLRQEGAMTKERAETAISLATEQGFAFFLALGTIIRGWALVGQKQVKEGIAQIRKGLTSLSAMGAGFFTRVHFLTLLAEAYGKMEQWEEALNVLTEALAVVAKTGERFYEAELYRIKGELLLAQAKQLTE